MEKSQRLIVLMYAWSVLTFCTASSLWRARGRVNMMEMGLAGGVQSVPLEEVLLHKS